MIRLAQEGDWPSILEVHRAAFGEDDVPRLAAELHDRAVLGVQSPAGFAEGHPLPFGW